MMEMYMMGIQKIYRISFGLFLVIISSVSSGILAQKSFSSRLESRAGKNVALSFSGMADGRKDLTRILQNAIDQLAVYPHEINLKDRPYTTIYLPKGVYLIRETLIFRGKIGFNFIGEDPATTVIRWGGNNKDTMLWTDGSAYFRIANLTFSGGFRKNIEGLGIHWASRTSGSRNNFAPLNINVENCIFKDGLEVGLGGGSYVSDKWTGSNDSEVTIRQCTFDQCTGSGIRIAGFNALDYWIWDCKFLECGYGINSSHGNYHVYNSYFKKSKISDLVNEGGYYTSVRGCFSDSSRAFSMDHGGSSNPFKRIFEGNTIKSPELLPIQYYHLGRLSLYNNRFDRTRKDTLGRKNLYVKNDNPYQQYPGVLTYGSWYKSIFSILSINNRYFYKTPYFFITNFPKVLYQIKDISGYVIKSKGSDFIKPIKVTRDLKNYPVFEVPVNSGSADIQRIVDQASKLRGKKPIVHFGYGLYVLNKSIVIPANSDIQLMGEGLIYATRIEVENPAQFKGDAMFVVLGPTNISIKNIHLHGKSENGIRKINGFEFSKLDSKEARVIMDQLYSQSDTTLFINRYNYTLFEKNNSFFSTGNIIVGGSIQKEGKGTLSLNCFGGQFAGALVRNGARMVVKDCWYEGNIRNPIFLDGDGEFMLDGAMITPYHVDSTESIVIKNFKGKITFANMYMQGKFKISPETTADILIWNVNIRGVPVVLPPVGRTFKGKLAIMGITSECNYPGDARCDGFKSYDDLFFNIPDKNKFLLSNMQIGLTAIPCSGLLPGKSNQVLISRITLERLGVGLKFTN